MSSRHTIILLQFEKSPYSRTYLDFDSVSEGLDGIMQVFEQKAKREGFEQNGEAPQEMSYDVKDVLQFIDELEDIQFMIYDDIQLIYLTQDREWVKSQVYTGLKRISTKIESAQEEE